MRLGDASRVAVEPTVDIQFEHVKTGHQVKKAGFLLPVVPLLKGDTHPENRPRIQSQCRQAFPNASALRYCDHVCRRRKLSERTQRRRQ